MRLQLTHLSILPHRARVSSSQLLHCGLQATHFPPSFYDSQLLFSDDITIRQDASSSPQYVKPSSRQHQFGDSRVCGDVSSALRCCSQIRSEDAKLFRTGQHAARQARPAIRTELLQLSNYRIPVSLDLIHFTHLHIYNRAKSIASILTPHQRRRSRRAGSDQQHAS